MREAPAPGGEAVLSARALRVRRGSQRSGFELHVEALDLVRGQALAVLGPNGSGKTTLLRAMAGLDRPVAGRIERHVPGPVTMVFQRPIAFAGSVAHNVRVALRARGVARGAISSRLRGALERFGIARLADRDAASLSAGELRRLALARALALDPSVLLLDEPFDDLDAEAQEALSLDLRRAIDATGVAVAVVTHDLRRAVLLADRMAVLLRGRVAQTGARDELLQRPSTSEIAGLVGMTNLVPGVVVADGVVEIDAEHRIETRTERAQGSRVWVGLRAEHLKLDVGRGETPLIGKGTVHQLVSDGVLTTVTLQWAGHELRTHLVSGRGLARTLAPGDAISLAARAQDVHLLDREDD